MKALYSLYVEGRPAERSLNVQKVTAIRERAVVQPDAEHRGIIQAKGRHVVEQNSLRRDGRIVIRPAIPWHMRYRRRLSAFADMPQAMRPGGQVVQLPRLNRTIRRGISSDRSHSSA